MTVVQSDTKAADAAGVNGLLFSLTATPAPADAGAGSPEPVKVAVDLAALNAQTGGEFASRGRLVTLPACALTTPQVPSCLVRTPVASTYDAATKRLVVDVQLPLGGESSSPPATGAVKSSFAGALAAPAAAPLAPLLLGGEIGPSGGGGTYSATSLSSSSNWSAGSSSGAFTYGYSVQAPPALGGGTPDVSLSYNSSSVDGKTSTTNSQASWVGDGWDFSPGFIERTYKPCDKDGITGSGDLCWGGYNATLSLGSHSGELVSASSMGATSDAATGAWHLKNDDGTKVEFVSDTATGNGTYNGTYAKVTDPSGTVYYFGRNHLPGGDNSDQPTLSASTVPVYSPNAGDECYKPAQGKDSWCQMWQRLSLDYVVDPHGNLITYTWAPEANWYKRGAGQNNGNGTTSSYTRATTLARIDYGQRLTDQQAAKGTLQPAARITFGTEERCLDTGALCTVANRTVANKNNWPDVPVDQECTNTPTCAKYGPTYFTTKRLARIVTSVRVNNAWKDVDKYVLAHTFPDPTPDPKDGVPDPNDAKTLWLNSIKHLKSPADPENDASAPTVTLGYRMLQNRVDGTDVIPAPPLMYRPRLEQIHNETGGVVDVDYQLPGCSRINHVMPTAEDDNTMSCYPVRWSPTGSMVGADPVLDWFNHYVVSSVSENDFATHLTSMFTTYQYGKAGWHRDDSEFTDPKARTWGDFRGFATVTVTSGDGNDGPKGQTRTTYRQGMDGDARKAGGTRSVHLTDLLSADITGANRTWLNNRLGQDTDAEWLGGQVLMTEAFTQAGGTVTAQNVSTFSQELTTASHDRGSGLPPLVARYPATSSVQTSRALKADGTWRTSTTTSTTDPANGNRPNTSLSQADGLPDLCTATRYATVTAPNAFKRTDLASETVTVSGANPCAKAADVATSATAANTVSRGQVRYDGQPQDEAGATGDPTTTWTLDRYDATGKPQFVPVSSRTYDSYGHAVSVTDPNSKDDQHPNGATTTTTYTAPAAGELPTTVKVSAPVPGATSGSWDTVVTLDPGRSLPLTSTDANGRTTTQQYDTLGRLTGVWSPGRTPASSPNPNQKFEYKVSAAVGTPSTVTTSTLMSDGQAPVYMRQVTLLDGFGRTRQTQSTPPSQVHNLGRMITDTFYDSQGRAWRTNNAWYNDASTPSSTLLQPANGEVVPSEIHTTFDGLGRPVVAETLFKGVSQTRTTTAYPGIDRTDVVPPPGAWPTTTLTDARGRASELWQYNTPTATGQGANAAVTRYTYTPAGQPATRVDTAGNTWSYSYDQRGRQISASDPDTGTAALTYDAASRLATSTNAKGEVLSYTYDLNGRKTGLYKGTVSSANQLAGWTFDTILKGQPTSSTRYVGGNIATGKAYTTAVTGYDTGYRPTGSTVTIPGPEVGQAAGTTFTYSTSAAYNQITGNLDNATLPALGGMPEETLRYGYNQYGELLAYSSSAEIYNNDNDYDAYGRPIRSTVNAWGTEAVSTINYDEGTGRVRSQALDNQAQGTGEVQLTNYTYNPVGAITSITDIPDNKPSATDRQCFTYDTLGRLATAWTDTGGITTPDPNLHKTLDQGSCTNASPTSGAVAPAKNTVGGANPYWQDYTYDPTGNRTGLTAHNTGSAAVLDTSQLTQITTATDSTQTWAVGLAGGKVWTAQQNQDGTWAPFTELAAQGGALANVGSLSAAISNGQLQVMAVSGGKIWHTLRNTNGSWQDWRDISSVVGSLANPSQVALTATTSGLEVLAFSGGKIWHTLRKPDGNWQTQGWGDVYSVVGPLTNPSQMAAAATASGLEIMVSASGKLWHTVRKPDGQWQTQGWGDVYSVTGTLTGALTGQGQLTLASTTAGLQTVALAAGKPWHAARDSAGQWSPWGDLSSAAGPVTTPTAVGAAGSGADLKLLLTGSGKLNYTKRDGVTKNWSPWSPLTQPATNDTSTSSRYPTPGTRNTPTSAPNTGGGTGGPHALLGTTTTGPGGTSAATYQYDATGKTTAITNTAGTTTLTWNSEEKLETLASTGTAGTTTYVYDANGNQLIRRNPGKTTITLGADELTVDTSTNPKTLTGTRYYPTPGGLTTVRTGAGTAPGALVVQTADHHGTGTTSIDRNTLTTTRRPTDPFGNPRGTQPAPGTWAGNKGFVGGTKDDTTGLTNLGARQYDPTTGRFITPDPIIDAGDPQQWNAYTYSNNDPVNLSDPSGLRPEGVCGGFGTCTETSGGRDTGEIIHETFKLERDGAWTESYWSKSAGTTKEHPSLVGNHIFTIERGGTLRGNIKNSLSVLQFIPGLNVPAAIAATVMDIQDGEFLNALGDATNIIPGVKPLKNAKKASTILDLLMSAGDPTDVIPTPDAAPATADPGCATHSFPAGTEVLLADGSSLPIEDLKAGDLVEATNPTTGETSANPVTATITTPDDQDFTNLTLATPTQAPDQEAGEQNLTTTQHHPFWDTTSQKWTEAANLQAGHQLRLPDGRTAAIKSVSNGHTAPTVAYDLTIKNIHTYYVLAGTTPILVHNCGEADPYSLKRTESLSGNASKRNVDSLTESMKQGGWQGDPIKVAKNGDDLYILDGHHRVAAAKRAGINVPYQIVSNEDLLARYSGGIDDVISAWAEVAPDKLVNRYKKPGFR
ncbi:RHS repeat-associated protein [Kitasatospora herbaricolor]|uniref:RHS repeat-associated core domain-containing protein n=1 Tax=Kitasatospora herbaricolor TaxID=68217 RepID=UPI001748931F|nr:RHS repeat-associated core domain-containing protein [Kitasatospora herbaricolor]MDQ0313352.1 RHS repeat-associated protein [Kitasatospora herbaricolor]